MFMSSVRRAGGAASIFALGVVLAAPSAAFASVAPTPDSTVHASGTVYALAQVGGRTIIGGSFTSAGGRARQNIAAINADGTIDTTFKPAVDGTVYALAASADGTRIYVGGTFANAGGAPHANLAALNATTGAPIAGWQADTTGDTPDVRSLAIHGNDLYVGGRFGGIDGTTRRKLVKLDATTGNVVTQFRPAPNGSLKEVVVSSDGTKVYAGGVFDIIGGQSRLNRVAELDAVTGAATSFNPAIGGGAVATVEISPDGSRFFFSTENNWVYAYDPAVSAQPVWQRKMSGDTQAMAASDSGELYIGGHFSQDIATKAKRTYFASISISDGSLTSWAPNASGGSLGVWAFEIGNGKLHAGGDFVYFNGVNQARYARFSGTP